MIRYPYGNRQGITALAEYSLTILLVVATLVAMTTYVKRALQARMRDARHYMITTASSACDDKCQNAAHIGIRDSILQQYEPYYSRVDADVNQDSVTYKRLLASNAGSSGNFIGEINAQSQSGVGSVQLPPMQALNDIQ